MKYIAYFILLISMCNCIGKAADENTISKIDTVNIQHFNIMIAPDLSNRQSQELYPRPLRDQDIIHTVFNNIYPTILNHQRTENQLDKFSICIINKKLISRYNADVARLAIDFEKFNTQKERIDYIKGRGLNTLHKDTILFMQEYKKLIHETMNKTFGADIWSFFNSDIDDIVISTKQLGSTYLGKHYKNRFKNVLILLTDGYIEADMYGKNACLTTNDKQCYYLSSNRIKQFRIGYKKSGMSNVKDYFKASGYGIIPVSNPSLKDLEVLILEMYDRSLSDGGVATAHPTDLEILKLFWSDWLLKSGVKRFEMRPVMRTNDEVEKVITNFLGVR